MVCRVGRLGAEMAGEKREQGSRENSAAALRATKIETVLEGEAAEIVREIVGIAERLDGEGLEQLMRTAHALETKGKIERFNRELNVAAEKAAQVRRDLTVPEYRVDVEETPDGFFVIQLDQVRVFFNRQELRAITRLCHAARDAPDGARRMFRWFEKERGDFLADAGIDSDRNPYLIALYEVIVTTYTVKGE